MSSPKRIAEVLPGVMDRIAARALAEAFRKYDDLLGDRSFFQADRKERDVMNAELGKALDEVRKIANEVLGG